MICYAVKKSLPCLNVCKGSAVKFEKLTCLMKTVNNLKT